MGPLAKRRPRASAVWVCAAVISSGSVMGTSAAVRRLPGSEEAFSVSRSVLSIAELLRIASFLENVNRIKAYGRRDRDDLPGDSLDIYFDSLEPLTPLANEINRCILCPLRMRIWWSVLKSGMVAFCSMAREALAKIKSQYGDYQRPNSLAVKLHD